MVLETPPRSGASPRWLLAVAVACAPVLAVYLSYALWSARLPDPMPGHWNRHGQVDGTFPVSGFVTAMMAVAATGGLVAVAGAALVRLRWRNRRWLVCAGAAVGGFAGGLWLVIAGLALDHTDPYAVPTPTWHILAILLGTGLWAGLGFIACGRAPAHRAAAAGRPAAALPRLDLPAGQRAVWSETSYPGPMAYGLMALLLAVAAALAAWANPWAASPVLLSAAVTFILFTVGLVVNQRGMQVGFGPWRWPRVTVPLEEIASAEVITVRAADWGGWGYRVRPGGRAVIVRSGPAVRLVLSHDREFVASTRDPDTVAGLVNTLVDRARR